MSLSGFLATGSCVDSSCDNWDYGISLLQVLSFILMIYEEKITMIIILTRYTVRFLVPFYRNLKNISLLEFILIHFSFKANLHSMTRQFSRYVIHSEYVREGIQA